MKRLVMIIAVLVVATPSLAAVGELTANWSGLQSGNCRSYLAVEDFAGISAVTQIDQADMGVYTADVNNTSYEVSTVPEPATMTLLGFGCLAVVTLRRRR